VVSLHGRAGVVSLHGRAGVVSLHGKAGVVSLHGKAGWYIPAFDPVPHNHHTDYAIARRPFYEGPSAYSPRALIPQIETPV